MNKIFVLISFMAIFGVNCVTQQLHLMSMTNDQIIQESKSNSKSFTIKAIKATYECSPCSEWSKIVWHGANYPFEGFFPIGINDWTSFITEALKGNDENREIEIDIQRLFLKTWSSDYGACHIKAIITENGNKKEIEADLKLPGNFMKESGMNVKLNDNAYDLIVLTFQQLINNYSKLNK